MAGWVSLGLIVRGKINGFLGVKSCFFRFFSWIFFGEVLFRLISVGAWLGKKLVVREIPFFVQVIFFFGVEHQ